MDLIDLYNDKDLYGKLKTYLYGYLDERVLDAVYEKRDQDTPKEFLDAAFTNLKELYTPAEQPKPVKNEAV